MSVELSVYHASVRVSVSVFSVVRDVVVRCLILFVCVCVCVGAVFDFMLSYEPRWGYPGSKWGS